MNLVQAKTQYLCMQDIHLKFIVNGNTFQEKGTVLITHWGLSGPAVLRLSAFAARDLYENQYIDTLLYHSISPSLYYDIVISLY